MAYTFLKAQGMEVGASLLEADKLGVARTILEAARTKGVTFLLPMDHVIAQKVAADAETRIVDSTAIPAGWMGLDIGPRRAPPSPRRSGGPRRSSGTAPWASSS